MNLTLERLKTVLHYDPITGEFTWLQNPCRPEQFNAKFAGKRAGSPRPGRYRKIRIDYVHYPEHRLAWFYMTGQWTRWPKQLLDHIDRDKTNNAFSNLRLVTPSENSLNKPTVSASGRRGVTWHKRVGKWQASIGYQNTRIYLGMFADKDEAADAYRSAAINLYGDFALTVPEIAREVAP